MIYGAELARARGQGRGWPAAIFHAGIGCLPLALPFVLLILWRSNESHGDSVTHHFFDFQFKAGWLAMVFRDRWPEFDMASAALIAILLYRGFRSDRVAKSPALVAASLLLLLAFVLLPFMLFMSAFADMRLAPYLVALALLSLGAGETMSFREKSAMAMIGLAFFGARIAGNMASLWLHGRNWERHLAALDHVPRGSRLVSFVGQDCAKPWSDRRTSHLPGLATARRAAFSNDQWRLGGSTPLKIVVTGLHDFDGDPSQMVMADWCAAEPSYLPLAVALARLPRAHADYVWLIDPPAFDPRLVAGMTPIWRNDSDVLYRIDNHRLSGTNPPH
jgi:hypothetical protein